MLVSCLLSCCLVVAAAAARMRDIFGQNGWCRISCSIYFFQMLFSSVSSSSVVWDVIILFVSFLSS